MSDGVGGQRTDSLGPQPQEQAEMEGEFQCTCICVKGWGVKRLGNGQESDHECLKSHALELRLFPRGSEEPMKCFNPGSPMSRLVILEKSP